MFRAEHPTHGVVAVKVLREKLRQDKTAVAGSFAKQSTASACSTPMSCAPSRSVSFLAIEWAKGELLERYVKQNAAGRRSRAIITDADAVQADMPWASCTVI